MLNTRSIPAGRVLGVDLRVHFSFLLLLLFTVVDTANGGSGMRGAALTGMVLFSVFFHEVGHLLAANVLGNAPKVTLLLPLGGVALKDPYDTSRALSLREEFQLAFAGPMMNVFLATLCVLLSLFLHPELDLLARPHLYSGSMLKTMAWVNVYLCLLNLAPVYPLDGGRVLRAFFASTEKGESRGERYALATRRVVMMGQALATVLVFAGIMQQWLMLLGLFLFVAVQIEDRSLVFQSVIDSVKLEEIMLTDFSTLSAVDTLEEALDKAVHSLQDDFPVVRSGALVGVISKQHIVAALRDGGNGYVQSAMNRAFDTAGRGESLAQAFRKITAQGTSLITVVENDRLLGIVTLQNLMHSMGLLAESRKLNRHNGGGLL